MYSTMKNTHNKLLTLMALTIVLLSCDSTNKETKDPTILQDDGIDYPVFDQYFSNLDNFSGNVLVAFEGKPIFKKSYGFANIELDVKNTSESKFRIGSITKQFTSMAIMILQEQGKLNVTDKLSDHMSNVSEIWEEITIHQLLTHTSGIMHSWALEGFGENMMLHTTIEEIIDKFKDQPLVGYPGQKFHYSGTGYFILSSLIEKVSDKTFEHFLKDEIFDKIGMTDSGSDVPEKIVENRVAGYDTDSTGTYNSTYIYMPILTGGGNLYSTIEDFLKWDKSFYKNTLISKESKAEMLTTELNNYAYGWSVIKSDSLYRTSHTGSVPGSLSRIDRYPDKGILVVILSNNIRRTNPEIRGDFSKLVLEELSKTGYNKK